MYLFFKSILFFSYALLTAQGSDRKNNKTSKVEIFKSEEEIIFDHRLKDFLALSKQDLKKQKVKDLIQWGICKPSLDRKDCYLLHHGHHGSNSGESKIIHDRLILTVKITKGANHPLFFQPLTGSMNFQTSYQQTSLRKESAESFFLIKKGIYDIETQNFFCFYESFLNRQHKNNKATVRIIRSSCKLENSIDCDPYDILTEGLNNIFQIKKEIENNKNIAALFYYVESPYKEWLEMPNDLLLKRLNELTLEEMNIFANMIHIVHEYYENQKNIQLLLRRLHNKFNGDFKQELIERLYQFAPQLSISPASFQKLFSFLKNYPFVALQTLSKEDLHDLSSLLREGN